ncbi:hypothetical protein BQ8482_330208 [Mesorhizobium delmotii]|uniref:Uncharacterized protein n=1 Tax=Mesorhizobium delmotii TaxID=1631247 RepID=A0A2P9API3_9HYPH|nr:hypothetical protein BQ8482_330208 [Mesorhizobium delmotii]
MASQSKVVSQRNYAVLLPDRLDFDFEVGTMPQREGESRYCSSELWDSAPFGCAKASNMY